MELQLIELYSWICLIYDKHPSLKYQRLSNNSQPKFTDQELITIYLFGQMQGYFKQNQIYDYILRHFQGWFPDLPSYQTFNYRLNQETDALKVIVFELPGQMCQAREDFCREDWVIDSIPIMLAVRGRSVQAKVAREVANQSYCASKAMWYQGVKLHLLARKQYQQLPQPKMLKLTAAAEHDLRVLQEFEAEIVGNLFADKAYQDEDTSRRCNAQGPDKKQKNQEVYELGHSGLRSRFVSSMRQPIESLFNWIIEKTQIQNGSKIRSSNGLFVHCDGKLAVAFFSLCFNY